VGRVRIPTLLVNGERSPRLFHRLLDRLQALLPDGRRTTIPGASHIMHEDNPAAYNAAVASFLISNGVGAVPVDSAQKVRG
jgi:non-heme chloroperoxidase